MEEKKIIILSINSEIGSSIALNFINKKNIVIGTYNNKTKIVIELKKKGAILYKLDLKNKKKVDVVAKKILLKSKNWDYLVSATGSLEPISSILKSNIDKWENSIYINCLGQIRFLKNLLIRNKKKRKILFFAGGGTNNAVKNYSAYTLSKILLIKFVELLDFEEKLISIGILGPGYIETKLHKKKIINKETQRKQINKVIKFVNWFFLNAKKIVSGRNFSLVNDKWGSKKLDILLKKNQDIYKLRRLGN